MPEISFPRLIAHRGASIYAPENTLAALRRAAELGAAWVECDLNLTADGELIILHDHHLDRTTSGKGEVSQTDYALIRQLDAGSWFAAEFSDEPIPSLDEWLSCAAALNVGLNLELKVPSAFAELALKKLLASLERYWSLGYEKLLISSFTHSLLRELRVIDSRLALGFLAHAWSDDYLVEIEALKCASINLSYRSLDAELLQKLQHYGPAILAYTVDDKALAERLFSWGVTAVFSNDPCLLG